MIHHLNVRVPWHDTRWNGRVCKAPSGNSFCLDLDRIRAERDDAKEDGLAGKPLWELHADQMPACLAEAGSFMNEKEWYRLFKHPYADNPNLQDKHGNLKPTTVCVPPFTTFAVPFNWMLRERQDQIDESLPKPLPPDDDPPFHSAWVFSPTRQEALCELFFGKLTDGNSLVFFYTKSGHPLEESISRLVVGVGRIEKVGKLLRYDSRASLTYPMWDRLITHSIRYDGSDGFLIPYHDYLVPTGDPDEDERRKGLAGELAVVPEPGHTRAFSFAGEVSTPDIALSTLVRALESVRLMKQHGIASGPWDAREEWLNEHIHSAWADRGAFPGAGAALEALGLRLGTALMLELMSSGKIGPMDDPWPILDALLSGKSKPPQKSYSADLEAIASTWTALPTARRNLLKLLSRFALGPGQADRWFDQKQRAKAVRASIKDEELLQNPYRIAELDLGDAYDHPVAIGTIDRGVFPDATVATKHPLPSPTAVGSPLDARRVRCALVTVLRRAAEDGDSLLSESEVVTRLGKLDLERPCVLPADWLEGNRQNLSDEIERMGLRLAGPDGESGEETEIPCLQLTELKDREGKLASILSKRAEKELPSLGEEWDKLLKVAITEAGGKVDSSNPRHQTAIVEQAQALERVTTRKLSALVGRAGTGKTTVLGALLKSKTLAGEGILFLAPTGKARVLMTQKTSQPAMTVAQFLYQLQRYDGARQRPLFEGKEKYRAEKTVVIDECSMLTLDDIFALLMGLDLAHVQRIILVGDPNQLPPIGVGRPFADLVAHLDQAAQEKRGLGGALARLSVELRTSAGGPSDTLRLASWYTREPQPPDADKVLSDLELGGALNDLTVCYWETPEQLRERLSEQLVSRFGLQNASDVEGFNVRALGLTSEGWVPFEDHNGGQIFQILSPVRMHLHGVHELNRWIQGTFRRPQLKKAREKWGLSLGDEEIVWGDKVILVRNGKRDGWNGKRKEKVKDYLANGEIGVAATASGSMKNKMLNVAFANRPDVRFGFAKWNFSGEDAPLELAYALTVHKAQGSEFGTVFVVLPRHSRLMTRELLYTALTRARQHLVLLIEGQDAGFLYDLTRPERSETARRNSNLFAAGIRDEADGVPYAEYLVHRTLRGELVRSKSELVIANHLYNVGLNYQYERICEGTKTPGRLRPDFTFIDDAGDVVLWEHLGMMNRDDYRKGWEWKKEWYASNGYFEGTNLFTTTEQEGLDMAAIDSIAQKVANALT